MKRLLAAIFVLAASNAAAAEYSCPDMSRARQVGVCATEKELNYTYAGYCSDDKRMYDKDGGDVCVTFENYKKLKNTVLWEADEFQGYQHCTTPAQNVSSAKFSGIKTAKAGPVVRIVCSYDGAADMVLRLRGECRIDGDKAVCSD